MENESRKIEDLCDIQIGLIFRGAMIDDLEGEYPVVMVRSMPLEDKDELDGDACSRHTPEGRVDRYLARDGDILFLSRGTRPRAVRLRLAENPAALVSNYFYVVRPKAGTISSSYLLWALNRPDSRYHFESRSGGTAQALVTKAVFGDLKIPVPSDSVQERIVKFDDLMRHERGLSRELLQTRATLTELACERILTGESQ